MSNPHLPADILDHVVNHLHDTRDALRNCCLVSKSWIPRTRKPLFACVRFSTPRDIQSWKKTFPDPASSPAHYTTTLYIGHWIVATADAEVNGWIRGFSHVVYLEVAQILLLHSPSSLVPFHGFSPALKSFRVGVVFFPLPCIFGFILSFPLLGDLAVTVCCDGSGENEIPAATQSLSPPMFTGSLELHPFKGMGSVTRQLLSLPGGIHFRKLILTWYQVEDFLATIVLVEECSRTLESLDITWGIPRNHGRFILHLRPHQ
jgi:hypothetical protein